MHNKYTVKCDVTIFIPNRINAIRSHLKCLTIINYYYNNVVKSFKIFSFVKTNNNITMLLYLKKKIINFLISRYCLNYESKFSMLVHVNVCSEFINSRRSQCLSERKRFIKITKWPACIMTIVFLYIWLILCNIWLSRSSSAHSIQI